MYKSINVNEINNVERMSMYRKETAVRWSEWKETEEKKSRRILYTTASRENDDQIRTVSECEMLNG